MAAQDFVLPKAPAAAVGAGEQRGRAQAAPKAASPQLPPAAPAQTARGPAPIDSRPGARGSVPPAGGVTSGPWRKMTPDRFREEMAEQRQRAVYGDGAADPRAPEVSDEQMRARWNRPAETRATAGPNSNLPAPLPALRPGRGAPGPDTRVADTGQAAGTDYAVSPWVLPAKPEKPPKTPGGPAPDNRMLPGGAAQVPPRDDKSVPQSAPTAEAAGPGRGGNFGPEAFAVPDMGVNWREIGDSVQQQFPGARAVLREAGYEAIEADDPAAQLAARIRGGLGALPAALADAGNAVANLGQPIARTAIGAVTAETPAPRTYGGLGLGEVVRPPSAPANKPPVDPGARAAPGPDTRVADTGQAAGTDYAVSPHGLPAGGAERAALAQEMLRGSGPGGFGIPSPYMPQPGRGGAPGPGTFAQFEQPNSVAMAGSSADARYAAQIKAAGGDAQRRPDGSAAYALPASVPVSAAGLAQQVRAAGGVKPQALSAENVAAAQAAARGFRGPGFYNGQDLRGMTGAEQQQVMAATDRGAAATRAASAYIAQGLERPGQQYKPSPLAAEGMGRGQGAGAADFEVAADVARGVDARRRDQAAERREQNDDAREEQKSRREWQKQYADELSRLAEPPEGEDLGGASEEDAPQQLAPDQVAWAQQHGSVLAAQYQAATGVPMDPNWLAAVSLGAAQQRLSRAAAERQARETLGKKAPQMAVDEMVAELLSGNEAQAAAFFLRALQEG